MPKKQESPSRLEQLRDSLQARLAEMSKPSPVPHDPMVKAGLEKALQEVQAALAK